MDKFSNISLKNIAWFNDMNKNNRLDMRPPYQRNAVWTVRQKSYLIDSILNGYPIPELIVQEDIDEMGQAKYIIVVVDNGSFTMLSREWLYTAVTRGRKFCFLCAYKIL